MTNNYQYIFSGSLPENAATYVTREADKELYTGLKAGKFCYVLNSRQTGKSSLRVRTMQRLREEGFSCAFIDLSAGGIQDVTPEQWYVDLLDTLIESFGLDFDLEEWWESNELRSPLTRFRKFIDQILLAEVAEKIVIFIDEIDSVLSLGFPTDDFFAFIRACYNQRADNPKYNRLTFCLLGVASPGNLIEDKQRTPFNIGQAINLKGFQLEEIKPLIAGLSNLKLDTSLAPLNKGGDLLMQEILFWTGGQPFLTQKLCQLVKDKLKDESKKGEDKTVEIENFYLDQEQIKLMVAEVVREKIIKNWEFQDEPEHLRTIRNRVLRDEQKAGYLLELYRQVCQHAEITTNESGEQTELQLSGLIVRCNNKLTIYNPIYREVFNQNWLENELANLRPYSENFRAWVASGGQDKSRLLRGKALQDAVIWSQSKSLSYQDQQFLAASQKQEIEEEIKEKEIQAQLERERKDREATEQRNLVLAAANHQAKRRMRISGVVLGVTLLGAIVSVFLAGNEVWKANDKVKNAEKKVLELSEEAISSQQEVDKTKKENEHLENNNQQLTQQNQAAEDRIRQTEQQLQQKQTQLAAVNRQSQGLSQQILSLQTEEKQRTEKINQLASQKQQLKQEQSQLQRQLTTSQSQLEANQAKSQVLESNLAEVNTELSQAEHELTPMREYLTKVKELTQLAATLQEEGEYFYARELLSLAGLSANIKSNYRLRQAMLLAGLSLGYQKIRPKNQQDLQKNLDQARKYLDESRELFPSLNNYDYKLAKQIKFLTLKTEGSLYREQGNDIAAQQNYKRAFRVLNDLKEEREIIRGGDYFKISPPFTNLNIKILSKESVGNFYQDFLHLLSKPNDDEQLFINCSIEPYISSLECKIKQSFKEHYFAELSNDLADKRWRKADLTTFQIMNISAQMNGYNSWYQNLDNIRNLSCPDLRIIDRLWLNNSEGRFGFSVQWHILKLKLYEEGDFNQIPLSKEAFDRAYLNFAEEVGWFKKDNSGQGKWLIYDSLNFSMSADKGHLPSGWVQEWKVMIPSWQLGASLFLHCEL